MKKIKVILAGILVLFTLFFATHALIQTVKVAATQNVIYADNPGEGGPIYPPPIFAPGLPENFI
jgi:hypothetical protein